MRRALVALALLLASPATATNYWVSPSGDSTNTGADSTHAKTLAWFNLNGRAGDACLMTIGAYGVDIRPRNSGRPSAFISYVGNVSAPSSVSIVSAKVDSVDGATQCISIKGVSGLGDASFRTLWPNGPGVTPGYDTLAYCRFAGSLLNDGRPNVYVSHCSIGDGTTRDYFHFGNGMGTGDYRRRLFVDSMYVGDCTFNLASDVVNHCENVITSHAAKDCMIERCQFILSGLPGSGDYSLQTHYDSNNNIWRDCKFTGSYNGLTSYAPMYLLNLRDNQVGNLWQRDTLVEATTSPQALKVYFQSDGNVLDGTLSGGVNTTYDFGDSSNTFVENVVKVRGQIALDSPLAKYTFFRNVLATELSLSLCNVYGREITFRHNTVYTSGYTLLNFQSKLWNSTIAHNIFTGGAKFAPNNGLGDGAFGVYCIDPTVQDGHHYLGANLMPAIPGAIGVCDSNLFYCTAEQNPDSFYTIAMNATQGGGAKQHHNRDSWFHTYGHDGKSKWGNPGFTVADVRTFDPKPSPASLAYSANVADGYVGAIPLPGDQTAPAVAISEPSGGHRWAEGEVMRIEWTATDAVGVTAQIVEWGSGTNPHTWTTIATGLAGTTTYYDWTCPSFRYSGGTIRVRSFDAVSNVGSATKFFECSAVSEGDDDPLLFPE